MAIVDLTSGGNPTYVLSKLSADRTADASAAIARLEAATKMHVVASTPTGRGARDAAIAVARTHTKRSNVVACRGTDTTPGTRLVSHGDTLQAVRAFEQDRPAAFVIEIVQASHNTCVPPPHYIKRIRAACDEHGVLLVADETTLGLGRTGSLLAIEREKVEADLVALSLSLAPGLDGGVVLARPELGIGRVTSINGAAELFATLEAIERDQLISRVKQTGKLLQAKLHEVLEGEREWAMDTRGRGLLHSMSLWDNAQRVVDAAQARGITIGRTGVNGLLFAPPIDVTLADITDTMDALATVIHELNRA